MNQINVLNKDKTGDRIKTLIMKSGYSYDQIADVLELTTSRVIYDWINGFKLPKINHLVVLSLLFQVKLEDILVLNENVF